MGKKYNDGYADGLAAGYEAAKHFQVRLLSRNGKLLEHHTVSVEEFSMFGYQAPDGYQITHVEIYRNGSSVGPNV